MSVTINDVARHANVSKKTVSRVINNEPNVREVTRGKVFEAINQLGYSPNISARRLALQRSYVIGLISETADEYFSVILGPAIDFGQEIGYAILVVLKKPDESAEGNKEILNLVLQGQVDGFIITPPCDADHSLLAEFQSLEIPVVILAPSKLPQFIPYVICDDRGGAYEMTNYLISSGHNRIGFVQGPASHHASRERLLGYRAGLGANQIQNDPRLVQPGNFTFEGGIEAGRQILQLAARPSAIFAGNDESAAGIMSVAYELGIRIPDELSVAGFDDFRLAEKVCPQLTTIHQPVNRITSQALEILTSKIEGKPVENTQVKLPVELVVRGSTGPWNPAQELIQ